MYGYFNYHLFRVKGMELNWDCGSLSTVDFKDSTLSNQSFQRDAAPKYGSLVLNLAPYYFSLLFLAFRYCAGTLKSMSSLEHAHLNYLFLM